MKKHEWEDAWESEKFSIKTLVPSVLVSKYETLLNPGDRILDVGCGNGRNSIYLACKGCEVDCFDVADMDWRKVLPTEIQERISFTKSNILDYSYDNFKYKAVIVARVIQYLSPEEVFFLMGKIKNIIKPGSFLLLSYTLEGGIFNKEDIKVSKYSHSVDFVYDILNKIFKNVVILPGSKNNQHVNYGGAVITFDIFASDPRL